MHVIRINYGCSFVAKLSWKKTYFFEKIHVFFTKYTLFEENMFLYEKSIILKKFFTENNFFLQRKI